MIIINGDLISVFVDNKHQYLVELTTYNYFAERTSYYYIRGRSLNRIEYMYRAYHLNIDKLYHIIHDYFSKDCAYTGWFYPRFRTREAAIGFLTFIDNKYGNLSNNPYVNLLGYCPS